MKVLVITGGNGSERAISLTSAKAIKKALKQAGYLVETFDLKQGYGPLMKLHKDFAVVFPAIHGKEGEDGALYRFLRSIKKPYIGSDPNGAKIAFHKIRHKKYCDKIGIPTAKWKIIKSKSDIINFGFPCILKAAQGGSSKEVAPIKSLRDLDNRRVKKIISLDDEHFVERVLLGTEITVGILGNDVLPVIEIIPPDGGWFNYENKYSGQTKEIVGAPSIKEEVKKNAQEIALKIHTDLKLGHYSRTDFIVVDNTPFILETNTPGGVGLTPESLYPKAAEAIGLSFTDLTKKLIEMPFLKTPSFLR